MAPWSVSRQRLLRFAGLSAGSCRLLPRQRKHPSCRIALDGMPEVRLSCSPVAPRERIPWPWIYAPVAVKWLLLAVRHRSITLPTLANPHIEAGGFRGESKVSYLRQISAESQRWVARWAMCQTSSGTAPEAQVSALETRMAETGLAYPVIVKPDVGSCGYGVRLVHNRDELEVYLRQFPTGEALIVQEYLCWAGEAGIFYVRHPGENHGRIYSLGFRYYPHVIGDGRSTLAQLIAAHPRLSRQARLHLMAMAPRLNEVPRQGMIVRVATVASLRVGALYRDGATHATRALCDRVDAIARSMPEFYYGRFDVRFRTVESLERAEDFRIIEVNGAGAEAIHIWDPELTLKDAYRVLFEQHEILFAIGAKNRARGRRPLGLRGLLALQLKESGLLRSYPVSN
jgi:hypothetical protein